MHRLVILMTATTTMTVGCLGSPGSLPPCDGWAEQGPICGFMNPEDLGVLPQSDWIIVSEMTHSDPNAEDASRPFIPGRLTAIRPSDGERRLLFPREWNESLPDENRWGAESCVGPPSAEDFQPHGIDVGPGPDGEFALAVVTHGAREVVDLFEIVPGAEPRLEWRGCVPMLDTVSANDVALLEDGNFVVTNFMPRFETIGFKAFWTLLKISWGRPTGSVLRWTPAAGLVEIQGSEGSAPNGIAVSADGRTLYVAEWGGGAVYRLHFDSSAADGVPQRDEIPVDGSPDNLTWSPDGQLMVAAQKAGAFEALGCGAIEEGGCDVGYSVTRIDPERFQARRVAEGRGAASVALMVDDGIWVGVFSGDSILRLWRSP
jgi:hypothetical protein